MEQTVEIDLRDILIACLRKVWLIVLCAVIIGAAVFAYTSYCVTPLYKATVSFYVNNATQNGESVKISSSDLATAQRLVTTYVNIIKSDTVLEKVVMETGLDITPSELRGIMTAESIDETELFEVRISYPDPDLAAKIANAVATVAPTEISNIMVGSSTKVLDYAKVPNAPYTPNTIRNAILGALVGFVLAVAVIVLQTLLDVRIKSEADLAAISTAPVLGVIPDFAAYNGEQSSKKKKTKAAKR